MHRAYDVRAIANIVLEEAEKAQNPVTNLQLNKVIYFMHVTFLQEQASPLVSAKIEAWRYGPVFREIYREFKTCGREQISGRATKVDYETGERVEATIELSLEQERYIRRLASFYVKVPAGVLVDMSHEKGGAWDTVWNHEGAFNLGMEITDQLIDAHEVASPRKRNRTQ